MRPEYVAVFRVSFPKRFLCIDGRGRYDIEQRYKSGGHEFWPQLYRFDFEVESDERENEALDRR